MSELVFAAFKELGMGPSRRELGLVATAIRDSGDEEALALWGDYCGPGYRRLVELAEEAGSSDWGRSICTSRSTTPGSISESGATERLRRRVSGKDDAA